MQNVKLRLDAWRAAERRRDGLGLGSPDWQEEEDDARGAAKVFHAEEAQKYARMAVESTLREATEPLLKTWDEEPA